MALMAAGIGAVGSIAGGLLGGKPKAPKYNPWDVQSAYGTVDYTKGKKGRPSTIKMDLSPEQQAYANQYGALANQYLGGGPYGAAGRGLAQDALGQMPGMFGDALSASQFNPAGTNQYQQLMASLGGQSAGLGAGYGMLGGAFNGLGNQSGAIGAQAGGVGAQFAGMGGNANLFGMQQALQGLGAGNMAQDMYNQGSNLLGTTPQSYQGVFNDRLNLLRQQAAPYEERAQNAMLTKQHAMGRMGSTGGGRDIQAFATGLGQADTTRQLDAMNLSEALYGRDQQAALQQQGMGANMMQAGMGGLQTAGAQGQGWLGLSGNLFNGQLGAMGQQLGAIGQQGQMYGMFGDALGSQANLLSQQAQFGGAGYNAGMTAQDVVNSRAQQRMANATSLFGFGSGIEQSALNTGMGLHGNQINMYNQLQGNANLGHQSGMGAAAAQASAANSFQPNGIGAALQGFGNAMAANPSGFAGMFGGQPNVGLSAAQLQQAYASVPQFSFPGF
jgi:hypothetical protein